MLTEELAPILMSQRLSLLTEQVSIARDLTNVCRRPLLKSPPSGLFIVNKQSGKRLWRKLPARPAHASLLRLSARSTLLSVLAPDVSDTGDRRVSAFTFPLGNHIAPVRARDVAADATDVGTNGSTGG